MTEPSMGPMYDLLIVGAGPAGLSAALTAQRNGLRYLLLEKSNHIADTVCCYQKKKPVMAEPAIIPKQGDLWMEPSIRETVLDRWEESCRGNGIRLKLNAAVSGITKSNDCFQVRAGNEFFEAAKVVIAIGTQGNPRKLGVPGEDLPHVVSRLIDPELYEGKDILVVGGGDAAVEVALALSPSNRVCMAVRAQEFSRVKASLERQALDKARKGELTIHFSATVEEVGSQSVRLKLPKSTAEIRADLVIGKVGADLPRRFLEKCGVGFSAADPTAPPILTASYEATVPGLFVVGSACGRGDLIKHAINQGYEVVERIAGKPVEPADEALLRGKLPFLSGTVSERIQALLLRTKLLQGSREAEIRELLLFSDFHRVPERHVVFQQNDYSESLFLVLEGTLEVLVKSDDGRERVVAEMGPGEFFGEMSLISGRRRSATVRSRIPALLWEVQRKAMLKFLHTNRDARESLDRLFLVHALQTQLFPQLDYAVLEQLASKATVKKLEKGVSIIKEGDPGNAFYFLRSGNVKVSKMRNGKEVVVAYLAAGQYFGEMALLTGEPRMATVTAIDRVEVIQLSKEDFLGFLETSPELKKQIEDEAARRRLTNIEVEMRPELAELGRFMTGEEVVVGDNVLLIDENRCVHCDNCVKACEGVHDDGQTRIKRTGIKFANILVANSCRHCENPLCMVDCPPGDAIARDPRGEVYIRDNCIGCGNCAANCPYDNIFMVHPKEKTSPLDWLKTAIGIEQPQKKPSRSIPVKCDLCRGLDGGPACVRSCPTGAVLRLTPREYNEKIETLALERKGSL